MKQRLAIIIISIYIFSSFYSFVSAGTILSAYKYAWSNNSGYINFENTTVSDSSLGGYAWSSYHGWINFSPSQGGVLNDGTGNLSGYAWGEQLGWIDFDNVSINSSGKFTGTATGPIIGILTFDCNYCDVRTDWRQAASSSSGGSSGGGSGNINNSSVSSNSSSLSLSQSSADAPDWSSWKNWYGINSAVGTVEDNARYAKQMGYDYISILSGTEAGNYNSINYAGLKYYINDPHWQPSAYKSYPGPLNNPRIINIEPNGSSYTEEQKEWYDKRMAWGRNNQPWPYNLATGYHPPPQTKTKFSPLWDFQQQAVIDEVVENIIFEFKSYENKNLPFTFAGYMMDVPKLTGDFIYLKPDNSIQTVTIKRWTGTDSGLLHPGITHEYSTYSDGMAAFYKKLNLRMSQEFPNRNVKWIIEPAKLYGPALGNDEWVYEVKNRSDNSELRPDYISQEDDFMNPTAFIHDQNIYNAGLGITFDMVGSSQNGMVEEEKNRLVAAKAGISGAWYNWFGRYGGALTMPNFQSITQVYPRLKLIRVIPNWDNLLNIPLTARFWNNNINDSVYRSANSHISKDIMYSRHWKNTNKIFAVFSAVNGKIKLKPNETVVSIKDINGYFEENNDVKSIFKISPKTSGDEITFANPASITVDKDFSNNQIKGNGYIFTVSQGQSSSKSYSSQSSLVASLYETLAENVTPPSSETADDAENISLSDTNLNDKEDIIWNGFLAQKFIGIVNKLFTDTKTILSDIVSKIRPEAVVLFENLEEIHKKIPQKTILNISATVIAPIALATQYLIAQTNFMPVTNSLYDLWLMFVSATQGILTSIGIRKKRRYWGVVYDSQTKQPIDPALVELIDEATGKTVRQSITDISGRFGFLDYPGEYRIRASKTHYAFPSRLITGSTDSIYENIYLGGVIAISEQNDLITPNIPMDPLAFDWNQEAKQKIVKFHPRLEMAAQKGLAFLFWSGFVFTAFNFAFDRSALNGAFLAVYVFLALMRRFIPRQKLFGRLESKIINVAGLVVEISLKQLPQITFNQTLTKKGGKFFMMAPKGDYILRIKRNADFGNVILYESDISVGKNGVVNSVISI